MPIEDLISGLQEVGKAYPKDPSMFHSNQDAANRLILIGSNVDKRVPEPLKEQQLLLEVMEVLNTIKKSYKLAKDIKDVLGSYPSFKNLDSFMPIESNKDRPTSQDLYNGISKMLTYMQIKYTTNHLVEMKIK